MEESELLVRRIREGTVIDHIDAGRGLQVLGALGIDGLDGSLVTLALNVPSGKYRKKDIVKVEGRFLGDGDTSKLAVIAPSATVNIVRGYRLAEKRRVALPDQIERIFRCTNPECITNSGEGAEPVMDVVDGQKRVMRCRYCERILDITRLAYNG